MKLKELSKNELKHIILVGTHLHKWQGYNKGDINNIIKLQGMVQYDPLNPAGRYHDHFFSSRIEKYIQKDYESIVYKSQSVFEFFNPNLCGISIEHFPFFWNLMEYSLLHPYYRSKIDKLRKLKPKMLDQVLEYVIDHGTTTGKDLVHLGKAHKDFASWKSSQTSSSALEYLWLMGKLAIVDRNNQFQKTYDIIERFIPKKFLFREELDPEMHDYRRFLLKHKSYPIISLGTIKIKEKNIIFGKKKEISSDWIKHEDFPIIVKIKGTQKGVIVPRNYEELLNQESYDEHMRIVGVLDPLIWDRDLTKLLFDFDYTWEVYKKKENRIWGYYILPLLYEGIFLGRMEGKLENNKATETKTLNIFNLNLEKGIKLNKDKKLAFDELLNRWKNMVGATDIVLEKGNISSLKYSR